MKAVLLALLAGAFAFAQQPVSSSGGLPARSREIGNYSVSNVVEAGYRFATVGGDSELYRAGVNFGNGMRLFDARVRVDAWTARACWTDSRFVQLAPRPTRISRIPSEPTSRRRSGTKCSIGSTATTTDSRRCGVASIPSGPSAPCKLTT